MTMTISKEIVAALVLSVPMAKQLEASLSSSGTSGPASFKSSKAENSAQQLTIFFYIFESVQQIDKGGTGAGLIACDCIIVLMIDHHKKNL